MAATHNIKASRVSEVIEMTGLAGVATKRVGGFSLGMGQRLGIAAALLGDPRMLILDEPVSGLDPEGVQWVRQLVRDLAAEGRTVFLSSHLMIEMSQTADQLLVIGRGRIIAAGPVQQVIDSVTGGAVRVRSPRAGDLAAALAANGATATSPEAGMLEVSGVRTIALPTGLIEVMRQHLAEYPALDEELIFRGPLGRSAAPEQLPSVGGLVQVGRSGRSAGRIPLPRSAAHGQHPGRERRKHPASIGAR
jgi:ABC-type multidrug transport system ATPase subunit